MTRRTRRRPPSVAPLARATYAPDLVCVHTGADWALQLNAARNELRRYGDTPPTLALPLCRDPATYRWPVAGRHVAIYGAVPRPMLRRLLAALLRDGAAVTVGIDTEGRLHAASDRIARRSA